MKNMPPNSWQKQIQNLSVGSTLSSDSLVLPQTDSIRYELKKNYKMQELTNNYEYDYFRCNNFHI